MVSTPRPNRPIFAITKKKSDVRKTNRTKVNTYAKYCCPVKVFLST